MEPEKENKQEVTEIEIGKAITSLLSIDLKIPVYFEDGKLLKYIVNFLKEKFSEKTKLFSEPELYSEVSDFVVKFKLFSKSTPENFETNFTKELAKFIDKLSLPTRYITYVFIPNIHDFPLNEDFGQIKTIDINNIKFKNDKIFWQYAEDIKKEYKDISFDKGIWLKCNFDSRLTIKVRNDFFHFIESFLGMLSILILGFPIDYNMLIGVILGGGKQYFLGPSFFDKDYLSKGWAIYSPKISNQYLGIIKNLYSKKNKTEIENKIILSSKIYFIAIQSNLTEIKFLSIITALESLLLSGEDRDYLGLKISEKVAFLTYNEKNDRIRLFKKMKELYDKRSRLVHGSISNIEESDVRNIESIFFLVFQKVLLLIEKYQFMGSKDSKGLNDYSNELKFS